MTSTKWALGREYHLVWGWDFVRKGRRFWGQPGVGVGGELGLQILSGQAQVAEELEGTSISRGGCWATYGFNKGKHMRAARAPDCVELWERYRDGLGESSPQARFGEQGLSRCSDAPATLMQRVGVGAYSHLFPGGRRGPAASLRFTFSPCLRRTLHVAACSQR